MKYIIPVLLLISCSEPIEHPETEAIDTIVEEMQHTTDSLIHEMDEQMEYYKQKKIAEKKAMDSLRQVTLRLRYQLRIEQSKLQEDSI